MLYLKIYSTFCKMKKSLNLIQILKIIIVLPMAIAAKTSKENWLTQAV